MMKNPAKHPINLPLLLAILAAIGITFTGFLFGQDALRILPLYISLIISLLQSRVSRYASLIGSFNSLLYAWVYLHYGLYATAVYAILFSCPLQLMTFLRWRKNPWEGSTVFRRLSWRMRGLILLAFGLIWSGLFLLLTLTDSRYVLYDITTTLVGILISFLTLFACIEYTYLMLPNSLLSVGMYLTMMQDHPEQITYLIYALYCFLCQCLAFVRAKKLYSQQKMKEKIPSQT